jgi:hypothetical protein
MHASRRWRRKEGEIKAESAVLRPAAFASCEPREALCHGPRESCGQRQSGGRVDTPHVVRCVVAGPCGYTCRPLTSRASLTRHLFIWSSRDLPRSPEIQLQIPSRPRSLPSHVASAPPAVTRVSRFADPRPTRRSIGRATRQIPVPRLETPPRSRPAREPRPPAGPSAVLLLDQKRLPKLTFFESSRRVGDLFSVVGPARSPGPLRSRN